MNAPSCPHGKAYKNRLCLNKIPVLSSSEGVLFYPNPLSAWFEGSLLCGELLNRLCVGIKCNFLFAVLHSPPPAPSFAMFSLANLLTLHWSYRVFGVLILHECFSSRAPGCPPWEQDTMVCANTPLTPLTFDVLSVQHVLAGGSESESPVLLLLRSWEVLGHAGVALGSDRLQTSLLYG